MIIDEFIRILFAGHSCVTLNITNSNVTSGEGLFEDVITVGCDDNYLVGLTWDTSYDTMCTDSDTGNWSLTYPCNCKSFNATHCNEVFCIYRPI